MGKLPDFIIGGASKSGTTSLYRWLRGHPDVEPAATKELRFFNSAYERGLDWYADQFPDRGITGEATPRYLTSPLAADRMAQDVPGVKVIFTLREPVARAYSDYWMDRDRGRAPADLDQALADEDLWERYVGTGEYLRHIERFWSALGQRSVHVTFLEDMVSDPEGAFTEVCRFLQLAPASNEAVGQAVNQRAAIRSLTARRLARRLPGRGKKLVNRLNRREQPYPPMPDRVVAQLREHYEAHDRALATALGRELPWT